MVWPVSLQKAVCLCALLRCLCDLNDMSMRSASTLDVGRQIPPALWAEGGPESSPKLLSAMLESLLPSQSSPKLLSAILESLPPLSVSPASADVWSQGLMFIPKTEDADALKHYFKHIVVDT